MRVHSVHAVGHGRRKILMDSHPYSYETSIFILAAPHEEVQVRQTKLYPGFTLDKLVQPSPGPGFKKWQRWRWPLATSPNAKIFAMWRKICDFFSHSGEDKNEMLPQYL